jgi:hypothetical protein
MCPSCVHSFPKLQSFSVISPWCDYGNPNIYECIDIDHLQRIFRESESSMIGTCPNYELKGKKKIIGFLANYVSEFLQTSNGPLYHADRSLMIGSCSAYFSPEQKHKDYDRFVECEVWQGATSFDSKTGVVCNRLLPIELPIHPDILYRDIRLDDNGCFLFRDLYESVSYFAGKIDAISGVKDNYNGRYFATVVVSSLSSFEGEMKCRHVGNKVMVSGCLIPDTGAVRLWCQVASGSFEQKAKDERWSFDRYANN